MKQCVTCNKSFLFAPKLKKLKKQGNNNYYLWSKNFFLNVLEMKDINPFLSEIEIHSMYWIQLNFLHSIWLNFNSTIKLRFNWIEFKFNKKQMIYKLVENAFKSSCEYVNNNKKLIHKSHKMPIHASSLGNGLNKFQFEIV